ncbi:MAG: hypothetical protein ACKVW3_09780 [Phycisphaerales bacterium]
MMRKTTWGAATVLLAICGAAQGQAYNSDFEPPTYAGSAAGTSITGQDGWYLPAVAGSLDGRVFTYAGNTLGLSVNPFGSTQMEGGMSGGGTSLVRAQHAIDFSSGGVWSACWDCTALWNSATPLPAANNIGSWSMQPSGTARYFQQLMSWGGPGNTYEVAPPDRLATADRFHIHIGRFITGAAGELITFSSPDPAWNDIPVNNWVRIGLEWDFATARVLKCSIRNLTTGGPTITTDVSALGWLLQGGPTGTNPLPTDIRFFVGGATANGNIAAYDNLRIGPGSIQCSPPPGPTCYANCDNSTIIPFLNVNDFICFNNKFAAGDTTANCDGSTIVPVLNVNDFICFNNLFAAGCTAP